MPLTSTEELSSALHRPVPQMTVEYQNLSEILGTGGIRGTLACLLAPNWRSQRRVAGRLKTRSFRRDAGGANGIPVLRADPVLESPWPARESLNLDAQTLVFVVDVPCALVSFFLSPFCRVLALVCSLGSHGFHPFRVRSRFEFFWRGLGQAVASVDESFARAFVRALSQ